MDKTSIAKLQKKGMLLSPLIVDLFKIYTEHIRPVIDSDNLKLEQRRAFFKPTLLIKSEKKHLLANNFELYHIIKIHSLDQGTLKQDVLISLLSEEECNFGIAFFELIDIVSRHKTILDLRVIYENLSKILTAEMTQKLLKKNIFSIITFCTLIGITDRAYHIRNIESL